MQTTTNDSKRLQTDYSFKADIGLQCRVTVT